MDSTEIYFKNLASFLLKVSKENKKLQRISISKYGDKLK